MRSRSPRTINGGLLIVFCAFYHVNAEGGDTEYERSSINGVQSRLDGLARDSLTYLQIKQDETSEEKLNRMFSSEPNLEAESRNVLCRAVAQQFCSLNGGQSVGYKYCPLSCCQRFNQCCAKLCPWMPTTDQNHQCAINHRKTVIQSQTYCACKGFRIDVGWVWWIVLVLFWTFTRC